MWFLVLFVGSTLSHHHHHHHGHLHHHHGQDFLDALSGVVSQISHRQELESTSTTPSPSLSQTNGVAYGPSITQLTRYNKDLHGPTIFHPDTGRLISLEDYPNYSLVIPLAPDSPTATSNQVFVSRRISGPGEFIVLAPPGHGVMAVIQSMDLRTAPTGCNDFIQFTDDGSGVESLPSCGKVDGSEGSMSPPSLIGPRVFLSPSGSMKVLFYHGLIWGLVRDFNFDIFDPSRNPVLRVEIVFTAYKECDTPNVTSPYNNHGYSYKSCTSNNAPEQKTCIPAQLFCDRVTNCAFEDNFGSDEYITNCLPTLINLLLPRLRKPALPLSSISSPIVSSTSAPTTITPPSTPPPPPTTSTTTVATTLSTSTSTSTTIRTTTPPHLTSSSTSTLESGIEKSLSTVASIAPFRTQLHEHFFDLSPESPGTEARPNFRPSSTSTVPTTSQPLDTPTVSPTATLAIEESSFHHTVQLPPEFGQTVNFINFDQSQEQGQESTISKNNTLQFSSSVPPPQPKLEIKINMTFTGSDNELSVQEGEGQVEQLQSFGDVNSSNDGAVGGGGVNQDASLVLDASSDGEETSIIMWIILVFLIFLGLFCLLRLYCGRNRVVWIPNPKALRAARKKRRENSVYANNGGNNNNANDNFPEIHVSGGGGDPPKKGRRRSRDERETTPPSYDILFPKSSLHDADVLP